MLFNQLNKDKKMNNDYENFIRQFDVPTIEHDDMVRMELPGMHSDAPASFKLDLKDMQKIKQKQRAKKRRSFMKPYPNKGGVREYLN